MLDIYYKTELGKLYCGDALKILPYFDEIDLILTDPPYGINTAKSGQIGGGSFRGATQKYELDSVAWDKDRINRTYLELILYKAKNAIIWGGNYYSDMLPPSRCWIVWFKRDGLPPRTFADCEMAWTSFDKNSYVYNCRWDGFIRDSKEKKYGHPSQKPESVMMWCLQEFTNENDIIVDPFSGSGSILVACERMKRHWLAIEKEKKFCQIAKQRLINETKQMDLFNSRQENQSASCRHTSEQLDLNDV